MGPLKRKRIAVFSNYFVTRQSNRYPRNRNDPVSIILIFPLVSPVFIGLYRRWKILLAYSIVPAASAKSSFADTVIVVISIAAPFAHKSLVKPLIVQPISAIKTRVKADINMPNGNSVIGSA